MKKFVVGIFGKTGSGKSTVSKMLRDSYNFQNIDVDKVGHIALEKKKKEVVKKFGEGILTDGVIDRKKLGEIVFSDRRKLYELNNILHGLMKTLVKKEIKNSSNKYFVIDAALLFEIGLDEECNFLVMVETTTEEIIKRNKEQRNWERERTESILASQEYLDVLKRKADFIIFNNGNMEKLRKQVEFLVNIIF